jgi:hypothetical protein
VIEVRGGTDFAQWLTSLEAGQEALVPHVLTMRMALRVIPGLCTVSGELAGDGNWRDKVAQSIARSTSALWLSCIDATNAGRLRNIAFMSSAKAASIVSGLQNKGLRDHGDACALAPAGLIYAVYAAHDATTDRPADEIAYAACSALSACIGSAPALERQRVFWRALDADIRLIEAGTATQALAMTPAWGTGIDFNSVLPELSGLAQKLRGLLPDAHARWDAWADWYAARLAGRDSGHCAVGETSPLQF